MKSKLGSIIVSVAIAFGLWMYVITEVSPNSEWTYYDIPVNLEGETALTQKGLIITYVSSTIVDLTLSGNRIDLNELNSSNITLRADLTKIYDPGVHTLDYTISYPGNVASNAFNRVNQYPSNVTITVEKLEKKEVPVATIYQGEVPDGYVVRRGDIQLDYETITVSGPSSVVSQIEQAVLVLDLTDRTESVSESLRYTLCDKDGSAVDSEMITVNVEQVQVDLTIEHYKKVNLVVTLVNGGGATDKNTIIEIDPMTIQVSGSDLALEQVGDTINLGTINLADHETAAQLTFPIPTFEGVTNDSGKTEAVVDLRFEGLSTREISIEEFAITNVPEGYEAEVITEILTIKVRGPSELVNKLTAKDITATVDFSNQEVGVSTYRVTVTFSDAYAALGILGKPSVTASLTAAEN